MIVESMQPIWKEKSGFLAADAVSLLEPNISLQQSLDLIIVDVASKIFA